MCPVPFNYERRSSGLIANCRIKYLEADSGRDSKADPGWGQ